MSQLPSLSTISTALKGFSEGHIIYKQGALTEEHERGKSYSNLAALQIGQAFICINSACSAIEAFTKAHSFTPVVFSNKTQCLIKAGSFIALALSSTVCAGKYEDFSKYVNEKASNFGRKLGISRVKIMPSSAGWVDNKVSFFVTKHMGKVTTISYVAISALKYAAGARVEAIASMTIVVAGFVDTHFVLNEKVSSLFQEHLPKVAMVGGLITGGPFMKLISTIQIVTSLSGAFSQPLHYKLDELSAKFFQKKGGFSYPTMRQLEQEPDFVLKCSKGEKSNLYIKPYHTTKKGAAIFSDAELDDIDISSLQNMFEEIDWDVKGAYETLQAQLVSNDRFRTYLEEHPEYQNLSSPDQERAFHIKWAEEAMQQFVAKLEGRQKADGSILALPHLRREVRSTILFLQNFKPHAERSSNPEDYASYLAYLMTYAVRGGGFCVSGLSDAVESNSLRLLNDSNFLYHCFGIEERGEKIKQSEEHAKHKKADEESLAREIDFFEKRIYSQLKVERRQRFQGVYKWLRGIYPDMVSNVIFKNNVHDFNLFSNAFGLGIKAETMGAQFEHSEATPLGSMIFNTTMAPMYRDLFWNKLDMIDLEKYTADSVLATVVGMFENGQLKNTAYFKWFMDNFDKKLEAKKQAAEKDAAQRFSAARLANENQAIEERIDEEYARVTRLLYNHSTTGEGRNHLKIIYIEYMLCEMGILHDDSGDIEREIYGEIDLMGERVKNLYKDSKVYRDLIMGRRRRARF